ncbi:hypothetical protein CEXT_577061 [Caerostris extrusa]|uniref:Uncharacterized protein n=1 Tax=Caerostris extrusa TaxID=172846 RepID=A0AAV4NPZ9_CAEEX|nr:hypothetical protein CEXT_577061 [Caerostris extrusa]
MRSQDASTNPTEKKKKSPKREKGEGKYRLATGRQIMVEVRKEKWHQRNKRKRRHSSFFFHSIRLNKKGDIHRTMKRTFWQKFFFYYFVSFLICRRFFIFVPVKSSSVSEFNRS